MPAWTQLVMINIIRQFAVKVVFSFPVKGWGSNLPTYWLQVLQCFLGDKDVTLWMWNHCHVSSCFVGYILLNRWTVRHGLSAAILKKKVHRYTYLKGFCPFRKPLLVICNTETKWSVCIHAYMCIKLYKIYLNMHMGIVKVMSVK